MAEPSKRAVVIGVNKYEDERIDDLRGAENDAREIAGRLREYGEFHIPDSSFLLGSDATADKIRTAISDLLWDSERCGFSLFYFSGHGFTDGYGNGYIAPCNMLPDKPFVRGIRMQELREMVLKATGKNRVLAILDCCYSGAITDGKGGEMGTVEPPLDSWFQTLEDQEQGRGRIILASSPKDQKSYEVFRPHELGGEPAHHHGAFTYHLLEGLDGKAAMDTEFRVTLSELYSYVSKEMQPPEYKVSMFGAAIAQFDEITLVTAREKRTIEDLLKRSRDALCNAPNKEPDWIFRSANYLGRALERSPSLQGAQEIEDRLNVHLLEFRADALNWITSNYLEAPDNCFEALGRLRSLLPKLSVRTLRQQTDADRGSLAGVCRVARGLSAKEDFFVEISSTQSRMISVPPALLTGTGAGKV